MFHYRLCLLCLVLAVLTGCAPRPAAQTLVPLSSSLGIRLTFAPSPPRALDPTVLIAHVTNAQGHPVFRTRVMADLTMPGMSMPPNSVLLAPSVLGTYTGQARFTMTGPWVVTVTVTGPKMRAISTFPLTVR